MLNISNYLHHINKIAMMKFNSPVQSIYDDHFIITSWWILLCLNKDFTIYP